MIAIQFGLLILAACWLPMWMAFGPGLSTFAIVLALAAAVVVGYVAFLVRFALRVLRPHRRKAPPFGQPWPQFYAHYRVRRF